ncbi:MAG: hypothetical protein ACTHK4_11070 [Mycobacteriales bacterium]
MPASAARLPLLICAFSAVAGCGGASEGPRSVTAVAPAVVQPSAGPPGTRGDAAQPVRAVTEVARRYYAALGALRRRMRAAPLARLMAPGCTCRAQVRAVRRALRRGQRYTDRVHVLTLVPHLDSPGLADVFVSYDVTDGGLVDRRGHRIGLATTVRGLHRELMLRRVSGRWLIEQVLAV